ncbi:hypothetical protein GMA8713_04342 [Grimontia marina]|uniref:Uncharacterized protein n=1 Tax=Grimontia marina TaxID=646534 RepID=A0A128FHN8_9GAMM|nr:hypothetical protein GMA8713_04342 [Grimontia marina]
MKRLGVFSPPKIFDFFKRVEAQSSAKYLVVSYFGSLAETPNVLTYNTFTNFAGNSFSIF